MLLDKNTNKIQIGLPTPTATGPIDITVEYEDTFREALTTKTLFIQSSIGGNTDILGSPATSDTARRVVELHFCNTDSVSQQIQVVLVHPGGNQTIQNVPLASGDTLHYNRYNGWSIQVAGSGGRGPVMKKSRTVVGDVVATLDDDIIYIDASAGTAKFTFNPAIVTLAGFVKEIEVCKIDNTANIIRIFDGTNDIDTITTPPNAQGGAGGAKFVNSDGTVLRTNGVG